MVLVDTRQHGALRESTTPSTCPLRSSPPHAHLQDAAPPKTLLLGGGSARGRRPLAPRGGLPRHDERLHSRQARRRRVPSPIAATVRRCVRALDRAGAGDRATVRRVAHAAHPIRRGHLPRGPHHGHARRRLPGPERDGRGAARERGGHGLLGAGRGHAPEPQRAPAPLRAALPGRPGRRRLDRWHGGVRSLGHERCAVQRRPRPSPSPSPSPSPRPKPRSKGLGSRGCGRGSCKRKRDWRIRMEGRAWHASAAAC